MAGVNQLALLLCYPGFNSCPPTTTVVATPSMSVLDPFRARYNPIWEFAYTIQGTPCDMVFTSVAGHLMELDFTQQHKRWHSCSPLELYNAPVVKAVPDVSSCGHFMTEAKHTGAAVCLLMVLLLRWCRPSAAMPQQRDQQQSAAAD